MNIFTSEIEILLAIRLIGFEKLEYDRAARYKKFRINFQLQI